MEVKTQPVKARWVDTEAEFFKEEMLTREPGLLMFEGSEPAADGSRRVLYSCPCGCGATGALRVGVNEKPASSPSWAWTGGKEKITLKPSVHHIGHWHGWLTDGVWVSC